MKRSPVLFAALLAAACSNSPWKSDSAEPVDAAYLMDISADDREDIAKLRATEAELKDELAFSEREIEAMKADKAVAEQELDVAKQEVEEAEARIEAARTKEETDAARERLHDTRMHVAWADRQVEYQDARIDWAQAKRDLAQRKIDLGTARLEQRKAKAVHDLPDEKQVDRDIDLAAYDDNLYDAELDVRLAEIDVDAAAEKAKAHLASMDSLSESIPEDRRASWRRTVTEPRKDEP